MGINLKFYQAEEFNNMALKNKEEPRVLAIILGGGKGTRLYPLTKERSKPAVPFGGKYRIVDIPISNCINSGYKKIYLLTQFNSASLHLHINNSYNFDRFSDGFVEILAAEQTLEHSGWYEGTADAVRKNFGHFRVQRPTHYIILSGDQLYKMNLKDFMNKHIESGAEITIAAKAVNRRDASGFGIMQVDDANRITAFMEKPAADMNIDAWKIPEKSRGDLPTSLEYLASMGIYIFNASTMEELLNKDKTDFGKEIFDDVISSLNLLLLEGNNKLKLIEAKEDFVKIYEILDSEITYIKSILDNADSWDKLYTMLNNFSFSRMSAYKGEDIDLKEDVLYFRNKILKKEIEDLKKQVYETSSNILNDNKIAYEYVSYMYDIIFEFVNLKKKQGGNYSTLSKK